MPQRLLLVVEDTLSAEGISDARELSRGFAEFLGEPIAMLVVAAGQVDQIRGSITRAGEASYIGVVGPDVDKTAPMSAAPMVYKDDGTPDWGAMWTSFCELALYGGPPHRGEDAALLAVPDEEAEDLPDDMVQEIIRGIAETTGLYAEPAPPGWLAILCHNRKMAAWLAASIILENVDAHADGDWLYVPARRDYQLKDQVKSVITVVAKTNHYWQAHIAGQAV